MVDSLCASKNGLKLVDQARRSKRWNKTAEVWCSAALTSRATLSRFWAGHPIRSETFISICDAVGVHWEEVVSPPASPKPQSALIHNVSQSSISQFNEIACSMLSSTSPDEKTDYASSLGTPPESLPLPTETYLPGLRIPNCISSEQSSILPSSITTLPIAGPGDTQALSAPRAKQKGISLPTQNAYRHDWGMAPAADHVWGRTAEQEQLQHWILRERCRWVGLFGLGGIGKTTLAAQFARTHCDQFDQVIWRSLNNAPTLDEMLTDLLGVLASPPMVAPSPLPAHLEGRVQQLLRYLQQHRCLIILDHVESILAVGDRTGRYCDGYEDYGYLFRCIGETPHQSCMLITSRERLKEQCCLEGKHHPVRCLQLNGVPLQAGQAIVEAKGNFTGNATEWHTLIEHYGGNPLALQIVAPMIRDTFDGQISIFLEFLYQNPLLSDDICTLLAQHFDRLSALEQHIMYWLAINQKPVSLHDLQDEMIGLAGPVEMMQAIAALQRRSLIEKVSPNVSHLHSDRVPRLTQKPIIMQFVIWRLIQTIDQDLSRVSTDSADSSKDFPVKDSNRDTQCRLTLTPLA